MATNFSAGTADVEIGPNFENFVKELRADLDTVRAELGVEINPDFTNFTRQLQDYLDAVVASLAVEINPDLTNFATDLQTRLSLIAAALGVTIEPDTTGFATDLDAKLNAIHASFDVEINPDTTDFAAELALKLAIIHQAFNVHVGVDQSSLDNLETLIRAKLAAMDLHVDVRVGADTRVAADELALLKAAYREMTMRVDADTSAAAAQIGALNRIPVTANVGANTGRGSSIGRQAGDALLPNVAALGLAQLPAAAAAVTSIGVGIQQISQGALLLPGIFAAAGAGIGTLVVGLHGVKDAFKDGKAGADAYAGLSADGQRLVDTIKRAGPEVALLRKETQNITLSGLAEGTEHLLSQQLPAVKRGMGVVAGEMNTGFKTVLGELGSDQSVSFVDRIFGNTAQSAHALNGAIVPIINSIRTVGGTGSDFLPRLADGFVRATTTLDAFLTRSEQSGDLAKWMREGVEAGRDLFSILGNIGSIVASVLRAGKGDGEGFLNTVDRLTERWSAFLKSDEGQSKMAAFLGEGREQLGNWLPVLQSGGSLLKSLYEASQAWSGILLPFLSAAASLLGQHDTILKTVLISYLAYRTLSPIFSMIQSGWASAQAAVNRYNTAQAAASGAGAGAMRSSLSGLGAALGSGGIFGIALVGAAIGLSALAQKHQEAKQAAEEQRAKLAELGQTLDEVTGKATQQTIAKAAEQLGEGGFLERAKTLGIDTQEFTRASVGVDPGAKDEINRRVTQIILEQGSGGGVWNRAKTTGLDDTTIAQALQGVPGAVDQYAAALNTAQAALSKTGSKEVLPDLAALKASLNDIGESAATLGGQMNNANSEVAKLGQQRAAVDQAANGLHELSEQGKADFAELGIAIDKVTVGDHTIYINALTEEQEAKLKELGRTVEKLPDGTYKITLDDAAARIQIRELTKPETKTITITAGTPAAAGQDIPYQAPDSVPRDAQGNRLPGRALGGPILGGVAGVDSVPILAMPGEHMLDVGDVDRLGGQEGVYRFRAALKAGLVRPMKAGGAVGWTDRNEIDLQQAINAVEKAKQSRQALEGKKGTDDIDRTEADLKIEELELKVRNLEAKKAGGGKAGGEILPQAELPGRRSSADLDKEDADASVDEANTKRNKVYSNPASTPEEKSAADRDLIRAQNRREETYKSSKSGSSDGSVPEVSLPGIAASAAGILAEGLLSALGLENSVLSGNNVYTRGLNTALTYYMGKGSDKIGTGGVGDYSYVPKNLPQAESESSSSSSSSSGSGSGGTKSADEYDSAGGAEQWRPTFATVLSTLDMPASWLDVGLVQLKFESNGNPKAINLSDSNAAKGTPSKGLMQVIDPTFAANRSELYPDDIWDPSANIASALRYTVGRYGSPLNIWGKGTGYRDGGWIQGIGGPRDDLNQIWASPEEFMVSAGPARAWAPQLEAINAGLPMPLPALPMGMTPRGGDSTTVNRDHGVHFHGDMQVMDPRELIREQDRWASLQAQGNLVTY